MIRSFPYSFNHPIPRGWPVREDAPIQAPAWDSASEEIKNKWRGFRIVTLVLAQETEHHISEVVTAVSDLKTGVNCRIFDQLNEESNNLSIILQRPGFRRLDLSLLVNGLEHRNWISFRSGHLREVLGKATELQCINLHSDVDHDNPNAMGRDMESAGPIEAFFPLRTIFPIDKWPRLRHFGLSRFLVTDDIISFL